MAPLARVDRRPRTDDLGDMATVIDALTARDLRHPEKRERPEQLRALEAGMRIDAEIVRSVPLGVDTPHDLEKARKILASRTL